MNLVTSTMGTDTIVDELVGKSSEIGFDPKEFAADCFAGALLMPKMAIERAFSLAELVYQVIPSSRSNLHHFKLPSESVIQR